MKKSLISILLFTISLSIFAKEKILQEKEYPAWIVRFTNTKDSYQGLCFGENEILDKVTKNGKEYRIYSHNNEKHYICTLNKLGHVVKNECFYIIDDKVEFISDYYQERPYGLKYKKKFYYDENGNLDFFNEFFFLNDENNHLSKSIDSDGAIFDYKYNPDGGYTETCLEPGEVDVNDISYNKGAISYYDKDDNLLKCFTNDKYNCWRFFSLSSEFQEFVKKYTITIPEESDEIGVYLESYENSLQILFWIDFSKDGWNKKNILVRLTQDGTVKWYDENENIIHGKDNEDEWWNTYQDGKLIYQKALSGDTYWDYDSKGNVIIRKRQDDNSWYIEEFKYDDKNRCIWNLTKQIDDDEKIICSLTEERKYNDNNFVVSVKWQTNDGYDGDGWYCYINGFKFTDIRGSVEYKFEKLNDRQMKVFPQDGKHWFVVELNDEEK